MMRNSIVCQTLLAAALSLGIAVSAQAGEFRCSAWIGAPSAKPSPMSTNLGGGSPIKAPDVDIAAELYQARINATVLPLKSGRWIVHHVRCREVK